MMNAEAYADTRYDKLYEIIVAVWEDENMDSHSQSAATQQVQHVPAT